MIKRFLVLFFCLYHLSVNGQYYFPPLTGSTWDTIGPAQLGWCEDEIAPLYQLLEDNHTKGFIILKDGKIALEKYFGTFTKDSIWYWASAGKTITSFLVGIAKQDGLLQLTDSSSKFLGKGWTTCSAEQEGKITIEHQLSMTTGLNYQVFDMNCKTPGCLMYKADAGTQWYYHNAPYLLLQDVLESASGMTYQQYTNSKLSATTGIYGLWYDGVFYSKPRNMARFGSLILNRGKWGSTAILQDSMYFNQMINTSQNLNESYGYLWWLNGKSSFRLPGTTFTFQGSIIPQAPADLVCGLGKNDQKLYVWPSQNMVIIRMGNAADSSTDVPIVFDTLLWNSLNKLFCNIQTGSAALDFSNKIVVYPNPTSSLLKINLPRGEKMKEIRLIDGQGKQIELIKEQIDIETLQIRFKGIVPGLYFLHIQLENGKIINRKIEWID